MNPGREFPYAMVWNSVVQPQFIFAVYCILTSVMNHKNKWTPIESESICYIVKRQRTITDVISMRLSLHHWAPFPL